MKDHSITFNGFLLVKCIWGGEGLREMADGDDRGEGWIGIWAAGEKGGIGIY